MLTRIPRTAHSRVAALALLGVVVLLVSACEDSGAPPMSITNTMNNTVILRFQETEGGSRSIFTDGLGLAAEKGRDQYVKFYALAPGVTVELVFETVLVASRYPLVVNNTDGVELFRRTFLPDELDDRDWNITITPEGIQ